MRLRIDTDHLSRDPVPFLREAGVELEDVQRTGLGGVTFRVLASKNADTDTDSVMRSPCADGYH